MRIRLAWNRARPPQERLAHRRLHPTSSVTRGTVGATVTGVHESTTGWATLFIPAIGYSFNDTFSIDATVPRIKIRDAHTWAVFTSKCSYKFGQSCDVRFLQLCSSLDARLGIGEQLGFIFGS